MSVTCEQFIGYTLTLKTKLKHEDFEFFHEFISKHPEYDYYNKGNKEGQIILVVDGMNGEYARLIFVEKHIYNCNYNEDPCYIKYSSERPSLEIYAALARAYEEMYGTPLEESSTNKIEHALWFHYA